MKIGIKEYPFAQLLFDCANATEEEISIETLSGFTFSVNAAGEPLAFKVQRLPEEMGGPEFTLSGARGVPENIEDWDSLTRVSRGELVPDDGSTGVYDEISSAMTRYIRGNIDWSNAYGIVSTAGEPVEDETVLTLESSLDPGDPTIEPQISFEGGDAIGIEMFEITAWAVPFYYHGDGMMKFTTEVGEHPPEPAGGFDDPPLVVPSDQVNDLYLPEQAKTLCHIMVGNLLGNTRSEINVSNVQLNGSRRFEEYFAGDYTAYGQQNDHTGHITSVLSEPSDGQQTLPESSDGSSEDSTDPARVTRDLLAEMESEVDANG